MQVQSAAAAQPARILVLEDDVFNAMLMEEALQAAGHEVVGPALTIPRAMKLLEDGAVDAAVIDLQINDDVSFDVGRRLDELQIPWAITTGHAPNAIAPRFSHVRVLPKPFTVASLLKFVDATLQSRLG
ncbi:MAG: response regulator [Novosphingobium sp.]|nr:MAG: response regulator [Novosphingobium sp.]